MSKNNRLWIGRALRCTITPTPAVLLHLQWVTTKQQAINLSRQSLYDRGEYVLVKRKWWQVWKPKQWIEFVPPPPPDHPNCRCTITLTTKP